MNTSCNGSKYSRMIRLNSEWNSIISGTSMFWKIRLGHALGVIQTWAENSANSKGPTCGERSIEWTVHMEDTARTSVLDTAQERVHPSPGWYSEKKHILVKLSPASVSSPPMGEREWINESFVDSGTSEEQETSRKSKDPSIILTASGTTHTTEEASAYEYDLDMCVQVQSLNESPAVILMGIVWGRRSFVSMASRWAVVSHQE